MTNEDLVGKLNHLEGYLKGAGEQLSHIQKTLDKLMMMDRTVTQHGMHIESMVRENRELAHDIKNCHNAHKLANDIQSKRIEALETASNNARGFFFAVKMMTGIAMLLITVASSWLYNRAELNYGMNIDQKHEGVNMRNEQAQMRKELEYLKDRIK